MNKPTRNLTLMTDLYELTMMNGYHALGTANRIAVFAVFFRQAGQISYAVAAGEGERRGVQRRCETGV